MKQGVLSLTQCSVLSLSILQPFQGHAKGVDTVAKPQGSGRKMSPRTWCLCFGCYQARLE